jgi:hypothetical protein
MLEYEDREDRHRRQTKEIFEALGRFVVGFESLINTTRTTIMFLVGAVGAPAGRVRTILHHDAMMAKALVEILRAAVKDRLTTDAPPLPKEEQETAGKVIDNVASRFRTLYEGRNALLHGTWHVGWGNEESADFSEFLVTNYKVTPEGLKNASDAEAVSTAQHLKTLRLECEALEDMIFHLQVSLMGLDDHLPSKSFYQQGKIWISVRKISCPAVDEP